MTHKVEIKEGFTSYPDCEFGPSGHYWRQAVCSCQKHSEKFIHEGVLPQGEKLAKVWAFDHITQEEE